MLEKMGKVYLVGAGPGSPELITRKGYRKLQEADVVMVDALAPDELVEELPEGVEVIYCGKRAKKHSYDQEKIHGLMSEFAADGKMVVRLQGGDPMIFGRGGEELRYLKSEGIECEVIPGVTAASAGSARLEIPLTDREVASEVTLLTGHEAPGKGADRIDWECMATCRKTIAIYMGLGRLSEISETLIDYGRDPETPAAVVCSGFCEQETLIRSTLRDLPAEAKREAADTPALIVIGKVLDLVPERILNETTSLLEV